MDHYNKCKKCELCLQFVATCYCHARQCKEANCEMPNCQRIKNRMIQQQRMQRRVQDETIRRNVTFMIDEGAQLEPSEEG